MDLTPNPARTTPRCKIKAVNPPVRSVSTPRGQKDLPAPGPVNPEGSNGRPRGSASTSEWSAERLCERLRMELAPSAWERLVEAAERRETTVEQILRTGLSEVA